MYNERDYVQLCGTVESISYRRDDTGFTVVNLLCLDEIVTVVGVLPMVCVGDILELIGRWSFHSSFGKQFRIEMCKRSISTSNADILNYLSSGAVKGIGPSTAQKIVDEFGEDSFDVLENDVDRLSKIKGISRSKALEIQKNFREQFAIRETMIVLERYGMTPSECLRAYKHFGAKAVDFINKDPYVLCNENIRISFDRADAIASAMPGEIPSGCRNEAGILHVIRHNLSNGHTCLPVGKLIPICAQILSADEEGIKDSLESLLSKKLLISENIRDRQYIFLPYMHSAETDAAKRLKMILNFPPAGYESTDKEIDEIEKSQNIHYEELQRLAIRTALEKGLLILTGGPGTGKTTTLKGMLDLFEKHELDVALAAPTGRAAKRMSELTGREAKTIHRLLEVEWTEDDRPVFSRNLRNPLEADVVVVDELSMVDSVLFANLLNALRIGCRLVMVGDPDQLPPVGAGNVLNDLIRSKMIPVVCLTEVFRQAYSSLIIVNAHNIISGKKPVLNLKDNDFFFMERSIENTPDTVVELCTNRLPRAYGYSPLDDIQIICPSRKGKTGVLNMNVLMQAELNPKAPDKSEISVNGQIFRQGDKVMQTKNNYDIVWEKDGKSGSGVFNGDIGIIKEINRFDNSMVIDFDDKSVTYSFEQVRELELAYAVTVHKSQGNEFEAVVMPVAGVPAQLEYRNLLYTAVTRAKSLLIIVGSSDEVFEMAGNAKQSKRYSALKYFLETDEEK